MSTSSVPPQRTAAGLRLALISAACVIGCAGLADAGQGGAEGTPAYQLNDKELKLSCKDLTGRMQVRILQIRDAVPANDGSALSRGMQGMAASIFGGSSAETDPGGQLARDRAQLEAYNRQLAAKKCKTFNLSDELRPKPVSETPRPR